MPFQKVLEQCEMYIYIYTYIYEKSFYPTPSPRVGCGTRSIILLNTADLNPEFSFSYIGWFKKDKEPKKAEQGNSCLSQMY